MRTARFAALLFALAGLANAQPVTGLEVSADVVHRSLRESSVAPGRAVRESGALARIAFDKDLGRELSARLSWMQGRIDYAGRDQVGLPLDTQSRHRELEADVRWDARAPGPWGQPWLGLGLLRRQRSIAATTGALGLAETSTLVMAGVGWRSAPIVWAGPAFQAQAQLRTSLHHQLAVDYSGVFDRSSFAAGRRNELELGVRGDLGGAWSWHARWSASREAASRSQELRRAGLVAGTVRQPRIAIDDGSIGLTRSF